MKNTSFLILPAVLGLTATLSACSGPPAPASSPAPTSAAATDSVGTLMGTWRMTALESLSGATATTVPYSGQIVFSPTMVSVQAANPDIAAPDTAYTVQGYEAFYGDLTVDVSGGTWSVDVESALARDLVGQTLTRNYEVTGDTLVLTPLDAAEGWRVTYERAAE